MDSLVGASSGEGPHSSSAAFAMDGALSAFFQDAPIAGIELDWFQDQDPTSAHSSSDMLLTTARSSLLADQPLPTTFASNTGDGQVTSTTSIHPSRFFAQSHPLSMAKHICAICGDRASGKHYGVYSCEGCKGFFKRTVRKDLSYTCREARNCIIDKRQRNRCQYCRYQKCQSMGMKREAVQEERQRYRMEKAVDHEPESTSNYTVEMPPERIFEAELFSEASLDSLKTELNDLDSEESIEWQMQRIVDWAQMIPHFSELPLEDQALLIHTGWNELILSDIAFRSSRDALMLWPERPMGRQEAERKNAAQMFDRIVNELTSRMRELVMDRTELGALRTIVLYNPDAVGLKSSLMVESHREKVYACLEEYCRQQHPYQTSRFAKLLLRLPALRSIGIKCLDAVDLIAPVPPMTDLLHMLMCRTRTNLIQRHCPEYAGLPAPATIQMQ